MVDVSDKPVTSREAIARGRITMSSEAIALIRSGAVKKGDPLQTARLAGIMAAEKNLPGGTRLRLPVGLGLLAIASTIVTANV